MTSPPLLWGQTHTHKLSVLLTLIILASHLPSLPPVHIHPLSRVSYHGMEAGPSGSGEPPIPFLPRALQLLELKGLPCEEIYLEWLSLGVPLPSSFNFHSIPESLLALDPRKPKPLLPRLYSSPEQR